MPIPDFLERYSPGDHPSAEQWNLLGDLHRRQQSAPVGFVDSTGAAYGERADKHHNVLMKNSTGALREQYEVAGVDGALHDPTSLPFEFKYRVGLTGIVPVDPTHKGRFGVFQEQVKDTMVGLVKLAGETQVQVDIQNAGDPYCDVKNGDATQLESNSSGGSTILWQPGTTGTQWCVIRIEHIAPPEIWYFTLSEALVQWTNPIIPVDAFRRVWNPSGNAGWGSFDIDCAQTLVVGDYAWVGFYGAIGAQGWAEMRDSDNGRVGIIRGLNCPDACVCGTDYTETTPCTGT